MSIVALEARVDTAGGKTDCTACGVCQERTIGEIGAYKVGTYGWVCYECAIRLDPELADFAHNPRHRSPRLRSSLRDPNGNCPECGNHSYYLNIGRDHWFYCGRHGLKWCSGSNLYSSWTYETEEAWRDNAEFLSRFREIGLHYISDSWFDRLASPVRRLWFRFRIHRTKIKHEHRDWLDPENPNW
jgi:hypothetical protein